MADEEQVKLLESGVEAWTRRAYSLSAAHRPDVDGVVLTAEEHAATFEVQHPRMCRHRNIRRGRPVFKSEWLKPTSAVPSQHLTSIESVQHAEPPSWLVTARVAEIWHELHHECTAERACSTANQPIVVSVAADPEPDEFIIRRHAESAVPTAHPYGPESAHLLQVKRGVRRVGLEKLKVLVGRSANRARQGSVVSPERPARDVPHNSVERPES